MIKGVIALIVSAVTLWWAFHDVDLGHVKDNLGNTSIGVLVIYILVQISMHLVRVVRFGLLVAPLGPVTNRGIFSAVCVGIPASFFLPLRLGELVRPAMLARSGISFAGGMAAVAAERIADGVFNVGLFFVLVSTLPSDAIPDDARKLSYIALAGFGGGLIFLVAAYFAEARVARLLRIILTPISEGLAEKIIGITHNFISGLSALGSLPRFLLFLFLTALFWLTNGAITWYLAESYVDGLAFWAGPFAISATVFAVMIPAGPAFAGTMEAGFRLGLTPYGVTAGSAAVVAICAHAIHLLLMGAFAGAGLLAAEDRAKAS